MNCPKCGGVIKVIRPYQTAKNDTLRHKKCDECGHNIYTLETEVEYTGSIRYMIYEADALQRRKRVMPYEKRMDAFEAIGMEPEELQKAADLYRYIKEKL